MPAGASCTLTVNVTGSINIENGGSFATTGVVQINGGIGGEMVSNVNLGGTGAINGGVVLFGANTVTIGSGVNAGSVSVANGNIVLSGTVTSLSSSETGTVSVTGGNILGGGLSKSGSGDVSVCGATISGGISFVEAESSFRAVAGAGCASSSITGTIGMEKGTGDLTISGVELMAADLNIVEMTGDVSISDAVVSDIGVSTLTGSLTLSAAADSDTTLEGITGPITVTGFEGQGDFGIVGAQSSITIRNSNFGDESVGINGAAGTITMTGNSNFSIGLTNNPNVVFSNNDVINGEFSGNTQIAINNNKFTNLVCSDNTNLSGSGNMATFVDGQCTSVV